MAEPKTPRRQARNLVTILRESLVAEANWLRANNRGNNSAFRLAAALERIGERIAMRMEEVERG